ncbi:MAG: hypothetical protein H7301_03570 [Cryobacterium sp.]|nr:hypothetical protein [Oligoflexia bacterium]
MPNPYHAPTARPEDVFKVLARTPTGRALLERFSSFYARGTVKFEPYPEAMMKRLRETIPSGHPVGACLVWENDSCEKGSLFFDPANPLGVAAPFVAHEIATIGTGKREKRELAALKIQIRFSEELRQRDSDFDSFLKENLLQARLLHAILNFEEAA